MNEQDDLARWADDDLVRALRAPGTAAELADEQQYVAAFRAARGSTSKVRSLPRRTIGRLGAGGTAVVVTVALSSGMAAAYTGHLPDPVQQIAHTVIGAPAPAPGAGRADAAPIRPGHGSPAAPGPSPSSSPSEAATAPAVSTPTSTRPTETGSAAAQPDADATSAAAGPTSPPFAEPSSDSPPTATAGTPGGMTAAGVTHRAGVGESVSLSGTLTTVDGTPLPDHPVVLQVHDPRGWHAVARTTTDEAGAATTVTPPLTQTSRFRWHTDHHVHSVRWLVQMVPTVSATATLNGATTVVSATTLGGRPGDRVQLVRRVRHRVVGSRLGTVDPSGSVSFGVSTPGHRSAFVVRLAPTPLHTGARARVVVVPPAVASVTLSASSHRVYVGGSLTALGTVRAADGSGVAGRVVHLQVRGPRRWFGAGSATTDAGGTVAIATPSARSTVRYRLRVGRGRHSAPWRVAMVPTLSATNRPDGVDADVVATAVGGHAGDRVVLLRRRRGRLVPRAARLALRGREHRLPGDEAAAQREVRRAAGRHRAAHGHRRSDDGRRDRPTPLTSSRTKGRGCRARDGHPCRRPAAPRAPGRRARPGPIPGARARDRRSPRRTRSRDGVC